MNIKSDIEIAQEHTPKKITEVAATAGIDEKFLELYGNYKAKVDIRSLKDLPRKSKLVLVTAISPTPAGEGKTTTSVGLADALNRLGTIAQQFFAFADPASEGVQEFYNALAQAHEGVTANGAGIVLCTKSEEGNELFADAPFPVILYNDSLKAAVGKNSGMIEDEEIPNTASWYVNGSFYSSWSLKVDAEDLVEDAAAFVEMSQDKELSGADSADSGAAGMVPMG